MNRFMWPLLGLTALGILFMGAVANRASALPLSSTETLEASRCPVRFEKFSQAVTWYRCSDRVLLEAGSGCTSRLGTVLTLEGVKLTITKRGHAPRVIQAAEGQLSFKKNLLQIADTSLILNLKTGELRMPGSRTFLGGAKQ